MRDLLITNPGPLSVILLTAGFAFIVAIGTPLANAIGVILTLLAFLVPFIRLSFLPAPEQETIAAERSRQAAKRLAGPGGPTSAPIP